MEAHALRPKVGADFVHRAMPSRKSDVCECASGKYMSQELYSCNKQSRKGSQLRLERCALSSPQHVARQRMLDRRPTTQEADHMVTSKFVALPFSVGSELF